MEDLYPTLADWVEEVMRQREVFGEREIYVCGSFPGNSLRTTAFLPVVDEQGMHFPLRPQVSQPAFPPEITVLLPGSQGAAECRIRTDAKGFRLFSAEIWPFGLESGMRTAIHFSEIQELVTFAECESQQE